MKDGPTDPRPSGQGDNRDALHERDRLTLIEAMQENVEPGATVSILFPMDQVTPGTEADLFVVDDGNDIYVRTFTLTPTLCLLTPGMGRYIVWRSQRGQEPGVRFRRRRAWHFGSFDAIARADKVLGHPPTRPEEFGAFSFRKDLHEKDSNFFRMAFEG